MIGNNEVEIVVLERCNFMEDRRLRKTRKAIVQGVILLLKKYNIDEITIQQIADEADINRATFYKHYVDKYQLLSSIEDEEIRKITSLFEPRHFQQITGEYEEAKALFQSIPQKVIALIQSNIELYQVLFKMKRRSDLEDKIAEVMASNIKMLSKNQEEISGVPLEYFHGFMSGAVISVIKMWVLDENRMPSDELITHLFKIVYHGPLKLIVEENKSI